MIIAGNGANRTLTLFNTANQLCSERKPSRQSSASAIVFSLLVVGFCVTACSTEDSGETPGTASLILTNGKIYSLSHSPDTKGGDASALAIADGTILALGDTTEISKFEGPDTRTIDLAGATVIPGLIESHTHVFELGRKLEQVDLVGARDEVEAVRRVAERARDVPEGEWIIGHGWDEGAWANNYPDKELLSQALPNHPVLMQSLHGFAAWGNNAALREAGIAAETPTPVGGEIRRDAQGEPTGLFLNRATELLRNAIPVAADDDLRRQLALALDQMAADGYVAVHEAGVTEQQMRVLEAMERDGELKLRFYAMLSLREPRLIEAWLQRGPDQDNNSMLVTRAVKAYFDGALGSRGARLLNDYSDQHGHQGISGSGYAFDTELAQKVINGGFQIAIHAIGDAGNRATLDLIESTQASPDERHRIEHAQVIHPQDIPRFASLGVIASMQPPHAVEDMTWAEDRLGSERIKGAYAWRALVDAGADVIFNADNPGSDHNIFYGLNAAITRRNKELQPEAGWYADQALSLSETLRAYTGKAAYASFREEVTGQLKPGMWADLTVMDIDPFELTAPTAGETLLNGNILMTLINGKVVYDANGIL